MNELSSSKRKYTVDTNVYSYISHDDVKNYNILDHKNAINFVGDISLESSSGYFEMMQFPQNIYNKYWEQVL